MEVRWLSLVLEIDATADPISGTVRDLPGQAQAFAGWTQLGHLLDGAITAARQRPAAGHARDIGTTAPMTAAGPGEG